MVRYNSPQVLRHSTVLTALGLAAFVLGHAETLTLTDAMKAAVKGSEEAQLLNEKESKLQAQKTEAFSGALPNVQVYANAGRGSQPTDPSAFGFLPDSASNAIGVVNPVINQYSYGVQAQQALFSFGRVNQAYRTAKVALRSQNEANRRAKQQLELQALDAFYGAVNARARVEVIKVSIKRQGETVGLLQSNFQAGSGQRSSVLLATSSLKALEPQRIRAESDADAARMSLNRLLGRPVQGELELDTTSSLEGSAPAVDTSESGLQSALDKRPDLNSMQLQQEALSGVARTYRLLYLPSIGAQGKVGILAYKLNEQMTDFDKNLQWQIGVGLQWNIFDGFAQSSKARQYDSDARSLGFSAHEARAYARIEIASALHEAAAADTAYEAAMQAREAADEAREMLSGDFKSGKGQITDLLSAEEGLRNAELGLLAARHQKVRAKAALRVALGMDLIEEGSK